MTVALVVLKWIGIALLIVLAIVVALLAIVLFVPVRYYVEAHIPDTDWGADGAAAIKTRSTARVGFHWLFHLVRGRFAYPEQTSFVVKALTFTLIGGEDKEAKEAPPEKETKKSADAPAVTKDITDDSGIAAAPDAATQQTETVKAQTATSDRARDDAARAATDKPRAPWIVRLWQFLHWFVSGVVHILLKPYEVFRKIWYTISGICDKIGMARETLESETFARAKETAVKQLSRLLRRARPKVCDVHVRYGTGDPKTTADILAVYGFLFPLLSAYVEPEADFDKKIIGVNARIKGRITIFSVALCAGTLYFNKDIRRLYARVQKIRRTTDEPEPVS